MTTRSWLRPTYLFKTPKVEPQIILIIINKRYNNIYNIFWTEWKADTHDDHFKRIEKLRLWKNDDRNCPTLCLLSVYYTKARRVVNKLSTSNIHHHNWFRKKCCDPKKRSKKICYDRPTDRPTLTQSLDPRCAILFLFRKKRTENSCWRKKN